MRSIFFNSFFRKCKIILYLFVNNHKTVGIPSRTITTCFIKTNTLSTYILYHQGPPSTAIVTSLRIVIAVFPFSCRHLLLSRLSNIMYIQSQQYQLDDIRYLLHNIRCMQSIRFKETQENIAIFQFSFFPFTLLSSRT